MEAKQTNQGLENIEKFLQMMPAVISRYKRLEINHKLNNYN